MGTPIRLEENMENILHKAKTKKYYKNDEKWVEGFYCYGPNYIPCIINQDTREFIPIIPKTVSIYINMDDKNNNRIWTNDIVKCVYQGQVFTYVVVWDQDELDFKATNGSDYYEHNFLYLQRCDEIERIGNIFDNPELLKQM